MFNANLRNLCAFSFTFAALLIVRPPGAARTAPDCMQNAVGQLTIDRCASKKLDAAEVQLRSAYSALEHNLGGKGLTTGKIKILESAWDAYRDAYLDTAYPASDKQRAYGSIFPAEYALAKAELTEQETANVLKLLRNPNCSGPEC